MDFVFDSTEAGVSIRPVTCELTVFIRANTQNRAEQISESQAQQTVSYDILNERS